MTRQTTDVKIQAAAVTDRGLNERRPLNEDSYLSEVERGIFVVADGVGGAEAGEVASQTAVEVLGEAFRQQRDDEDVEDLMEIAIQRANDAIHRQAREDKRFSMMATTIVVLHLHGLRATVGHVGDSRIYRITPDGSIRRETEDHSVVEEEVRAGRMTPEQAQHHPSRNVISRALGAEPDVEVDLNTFEVESGTTFLLCTDGITRHIDDRELARIVSGAANLDAACQEMKRLCFERGAEDNLTAVLVRVGDAPTQRLAPAAADDGWDEEQTLISGPKPEADTSAAAAAVPAPPAARAPAVEDRAPDTSSAALRNFGHADDDDDDDGWRDPRTKLSPPPPTRPVAAAKKGVGAGIVFFMLLLVLAFSGAAFYAGMFYEGQRRPASNSNVAASPTPAQSARATGAAVTFEAERGRVDSSFFTEAERRASDLAAQPSKADDPEFLYFYGRALLLSNRAPDAAVQFEKAMGIIRQQGKSSQMSLLLDAQMANATAQLRSNNLDGAKKTADSLGQLYPAEGGATPAPSPTPTLAPTPVAQF